MKTFLIQLILILIFLLILIYGGLSIFFFFDKDFIEQKAVCRDNGCSIVLNGAWGVASPYEPDNYFNDWCNAMVGTKKECI